MPFSKRFEKSQFCWPRIGQNRVQLNHAQLMALVDGMDWKRVHAIASNARSALGECLRKLRDYAESARNLAGMCFYFRYENARFGAS